MTGKQTKEQAAKAELLVPLKGDIIPLSHVPDPAFAQKMVGDGIAIDPVEGKLFAPYDGKVTLIHPARHAVSLLTDEGLELLMHIGIDTVKLKGVGFNVKVEEGQQVNTGDLLIEFDLDDIATNAASLITPILVTNTELVGSFKFTEQARVEVGESLATISLGGTNNTADATGETQISKMVTIANAGGIHARPAAHLVKVAKAYQGEIKLLAGQRSGNVRSVTAIMGLNLGFGDEIYFQSNGTDANEALTALIAAVQSGLGEEVQEISSAKQISPKEPSLLFPETQDSNLLKGTSASPGFGVGPLFIKEKEVFKYADTTNDINTDARAFEQALNTAKAVLKESVQAHQSVGEKDKYEILSAHLELLDDPSLSDETTSHIKAGKSAPSAWQAAIDQQVNVLEGLTNPLMQQRAADLRDVGNRVMRELLGHSQDPMADLPENVILAAEEFTPSDISALNPQKVAAVLTTGGSASSHASIIARSQGIAMIAAVNPALLQQTNETLLLVDANKGTVLISPSDKALNELEDQRAAADAFKQKAQAIAHEPAITQDSVEIEIAANIGDVNEAALAKSNGADGIGLLRSEFLFLDRLTAPDEEEQYQAYQTLFKGIGADKPVIVRTLDIGGDKPLPYVKIADEENPFLGERGIRISLDRPELLRVQFSALLRASVGNRLRIMLPMVSSIKELRLARQVLNEEVAKLTDQGITGIENTELGIMIEVPSAAVMADILAQEADFFSIGTNDLVQYTLAIDRGNSRLAPLADNLDPAVLRMIDLTVKGAKKHNRWVGVCGGMAAQPLAQPILVGLGVDELSVNISSVAETKYNVRNLNKADCQALAAKALNCETTDAVKQLVNDSNML